MSKLSTALIILIMIVFIGLREVNEFNKSEVVYTGTVVDKVKTSDKYERRLLSVKYEDGSTGHFHVNAFTYKNRSIGSSYSSSLNYTPFLGASGYAYVPSEAGNILISFFYLLVSVLSVLYIISKVARYCFDNKDQWRF